MSTLSAVGRAATPTLQSGGGQAALRAELARFEKQRSDCVNCESAKTLKGQENIRSLDSQIRTLKDQLRAVQQPGSGAAANESRSSTAASTPGRVDVYA